MIVLQSFLFTKIIRIQTRTAAGPARRTKLYTLKLYSSRLKYRAYPTRSAVLELVISCFTKRAVNLVQTTLKRNTSWNLLFSFSSLRERLKSSEAPIAAAERPPDPATPAPPSLLDATAVG